MENIVNLQKQIGNKEGKKKRNECKIYQKELKLNIISITGGKKKKKRINKKKSNDLSGGKNCLLKTA